VAQTRPARQCQTSSSPNDLNRPRLCQKSGVKLPVGKILTKAPLFEAPSHSSSCFTVKRKGKVQSFPTASLWSDF